MKYILIILIALFYLLASGQSGDSLNRPLEIEKCMKQAYSVSKFQQIVDSLQMDIDKLCDYPVIFPIKKLQRISSGIGMRKHPVYRMKQFHTGIDIPEAKGTPVYAAGNGAVSSKRYDSGYGYFIEITHVGGFRSFYAH